MLEKWELWYTGSWESRPGFKPQPCCWWARWLILDKKLNFFELHSLVCSNAIQELCCKIGSEPEHRVLWIPSECYYYYYCQLGHLEKCLIKRKRGFNCRNSAQIHKLTCKEMTNGVLKSIFSLGVAEKSSMLPELQSRQGFFLNAMLTELKWTVWNTRMRMRSKLLNKQNMNLICPLKDMALHNWAWLAKDAHLGVCLWRSEV